MLNTAEFFDIKTIEKLRKINGRELDDYDNFSWHIALYEDGELLGAARLYRYGGGVMLDKPALYKENAFHSELLLRTLMLKAVTAGFKYVYADKDNGLITKYAPHKDGIIKADIAHIEEILSGGCNKCQAT
jgi:hypothetical protein